MKHGLLIVVALFAFGCNKKDPAPGSTGAPGQSKEELGEVVAKIDDVSITVGELQDRINKQSPYIRARYTSLDRKKEFLDNLIRFEVLAKAAAEKGYDKDPDVVRTMKQVMIQKLMKEEFDTRVKLEDIGEAEMQAFYKEHEAEFNKPEQVRVSAIVVKDKAKAQKVAAEAKGKGGETNKDFRDLVIKHTEDEDSKVRGGDLRYFDSTTTEVPKPVVEASFKLQKAGEVAGPIETDRGYYIVKQSGRRQALAKSYEEVKRQIQNRIYRDKRTAAMETFVKELMGKSKITIDEDKLAKVQVDVTPGEQPGDPHEGVIPPAGVETQMPGAAPPPGLVPAPEPGAAPVPGGAPAPAPGSNP